ncbi:hypothetical protein PVAG01_09405 [Phlyctema vagabunda]|uniref:Major facilitator superfamily (MFS) profile domain-containing protein n=1 Tax=Phlyctema vagabunda TaxID=108571 RepID=A0ABR4P7A9_9HELO
MRMMALYETIGLRSLVRSSRDVKYLCLQRLVRHFAYGSSTLILVLYLRELAIPGKEVGFFMTLTLLGDVVISLLLTLVADRIGRRNILAGGSLLMTGSGIAFATCSNYWILLAASIFGVISPSGHEIGPFKAIEESTIAQLVPANQRSAVIAWYYLSGTFGAAAGTLTCGWTVEAILLRQHWNKIHAYRAIFCLYACMGLLKLALSLALSQHCEQVMPKAEEADERTALLTTRKNLLADSKRKTTCLPSFSHETRQILPIICGLLMLDNLGSSLASTAWVSYFFSQKFALPEKGLGTVFFATNLASSLLNLLSASIAQQIGLVKTIVFTKLPSNISAALIPLPSSAQGALAILIFRMSTFDLNVAPRQAFVSSAVLPSERTAVLGILNVSITLAQSTGPIIAGYLMETERFWIAFILNGSLKGCNDLLFGIIFWNWKGRDDKKILESEQESGNQSDSTSVETRG